jgi:DNA-binding NtrC family response regulator
MPLEGALLALVEDDPIMGESLSQRLDLEGAKVLWWRLRADAVQGLSAGRPDVVICDLSLPDGTGEEVFEAVRLQDRTPPFLFMTAYADIDQAVRLMKAGAGDYLSKPFEMASLLHRIEALLLARRVPPSTAVDLKEARGEAERALIERMLFETGGRIGVAAARLKVSRTTLWMRMKALGLGESGDVQKPEHGRRMMFNNLNKPLK